jgi:hypothetical protein
MPLKKIQLRPGINRENTRYTTEGGWYDCDKVRFRYGTPEKIGGWSRISNNTYLGIARSLWPWATLNYATYLGVGTHLKYYVMSGGAYNDVTPIRATRTLPNSPFTGNGTTTVTVNDPAHGSVNGDFVTYSGVTGGSAALLNREFQITYVDVNTYTIVTTATVPIGATGGAAVSGAYQVNVGNEVVVPIFGWGAGAWGAGAWGVGTSSADTLRVWNHNNFGEDLIFGPQGGALYYWDASAGLSTRGVLLSSLAGASDVPQTHNILIVSDTSRFVIAFGCPDYGSSVLDPMLIRWSDQESAVNWTPAATNQAGSVRLSRGSRILGVAQVRQELLVWTDTALYALQYLGPPIVWGAQLLADNISLVNERALTVAAGVMYWMGDEKFYMYDGRVQTMPCDVRQYVFNDFNFAQAAQVFASTVEQFTEIWWFYCSANSNTVDRYVVYNYVEKVWYYGTMARTAWVDANVVSDVPIAATYVNNLVFHETGVDDNATGTGTAIPAFITSSEFDIDDGHNFGFVWRVLPDVTFRGSTAAAPSATMTLLPLQNSGSGYNNPSSVGGSDSGVVVRSATVPIEQFTGQVNVRVRGRQMSLKLASDGLGVQWQSGSPRIDIRPDGRKS